MSEQVYKDMIEVMNKRAVGYGAMDIPEYYRVVETLFTPEEAAINNAMPKGTFTAADLAKIMNRDDKEMGVVLKRMADKGLCHSYTREGVRVFRAMPFVPGIFEFVFYRGTTTDYDKKLAQYIYEYKKIWETKQPIIIPYPMQRVITVDRTVKTGNSIHTYDQVKSYIEQNELIAVGRCYCRHLGQLRDQDTHGMPMDTCMWLGRNAEFGIDCLGARRITQEEALKILDECEEAGLVHQAQNITDDISYICNCDRWHCFSIKLALQQTHPAKVFNSGFEPRFDPDLCTACETCIGRCPAEALTMGEDNIPQVNWDRCFGCAVCATGCPNGTISMVTKPEFEAPPKNQKGLREAMIASLTKQA
jgi:Pyruvate/2-oxoacid:ferredoxin oxidoreductase delta subunit